MSYRFAVCFASLLACMTGLAPAQTPAEIPRGCTPHIQPVSKGSIDWCEGYVVAQGIGQARGTTNKDRLSAIRAAEVVAVRNALAIVVGLPVDGSATLAAVGNAEVHLRGRVKGHKSVSVDWRPDLNPPECRMTVRVPLWGIEGVGTLVYASQQQRAHRSRNRRLQLVQPAPTGEYEVLIVDTRGLNARPCLFPTIGTPDGRVLYDVATLSAQDQKYAPPARYVESTLSFDALKATSSTLARRQSVTTTRPPSMRVPSDVVQLRDRGFWCTQTPGTPIRPAGKQQPISSPPIATSQRTTTRPTSQPTTQPTRRRRRRVVKAIVTNGPDKTRITLTREDADRLRKDPETSHLLKNGKVVIVTDSVAAGIEGRIPPAFEEGMLALHID